MDKPEDHWSRLNHLQLGRFAEYLVKMNFTRLDVSVFTAEVDDRGIDFVIRTDSGKHYDVQVKSVRGSSYIFLRQDKFTPRENMLVAIVRFAHDGEPPKLYLVPSTTCGQSDGPFVNRPYPNLRSKPEWGLTWSKRTVERLESFKFCNTVRRLCTSWQEED